MDTTDNTDTTDTMGNMNTMETMVKRTSVITLPSQAPPSRGPWGPCWGVPVRAVYTGLESPVGMHPTLMHSSINRHASQY